MLIAALPGKALQLLSTAPVCTTSLRWKHWERMPDQFWRRPPGPGETPKVYPLEPAAEAVKNGPYRLDRWTDWRMKKDYLRRQCVIKLGRKRSMMDTIYKNDILPVEIRDLAAQEVWDTLPRDSYHNRLTTRCALTSRARACVQPWRVSRHMFRHLADYNKLSGVQRGIW